MDVLKVFPSSPGQTAVALGAGTVLDEDTIELDALLEPCEEEEDKLCDALDGLGEGERLGLEFDGLDDELGVGLGDKPELGVLDELEELDELTKLDDGDGDGLEDVLGDGLREELGLGLGVGVGEHELT